MVIKTATKTVLKNEKIDLDSVTIGELVQRYPKASDVLEGFGLHCIGCHANPYDTVKTGALAHGMSEEDVSLMIEKLEEVVKNSSIGDTQKLQGISGNIQGADVKGGKSKEALIKISSAAAKKIKEIMKKQKKANYYLRFSVVKGGCAGMSYNMGLTKDRNSDDVLFKSGGIDVVMDYYSAQSVKGLKLDFVEELSGTGFIFENPNAKRSCGCGKSFR